MYNFYKDIACSDNITIAQIENDRNKPAEYKLQRIEHPSFETDALGHSIGFSGVPITMKQAYAGVKEYNEYVRFLEATPGFISAFVENSLMISKEHALALWPKETVDKIFSLKEYYFETPLRIYQDVLYDCNYEQKYSAGIAGEKLVFPVGEHFIKNWNGKRCIWNWVDDGHDFTYYLWDLLGARYWQDDDADYDEDAVTYRFDCYEQFRDLGNVEIQFIKIFEKLEKLGYLQSYTIKPENVDPRWYHYGKSDGSMDVALIDENFKKNKLLMEQIELLMWAKSETLQQQYYFLTDKDNKQFLSPVSGDYYGHFKLKIFGHIRCHFAHMHVIKREYPKEKVFFADKQTAIEAGYRPCSLCISDEYEKWKAEKQIISKVVFDFGGKFKQRTLDVECVKVKDVIEDIKNANYGDLTFQLYRIFGDIITNAVKAHNIIEACDIKFSEAEELINSVAYSYIDKVFENARVVDIVSKEKLEISADEKEEILQALKDWFYVKLYDRSTGDEDGMAFVIACVRAFIAKGKWHYGLRKGEGTIITDVKQWPKPEIDGESVAWRQNSEILKPVIWFGPQNGKQVDYWSIYGTVEDLKVKDSIWFPHPYLPAAGTLACTDLPADVGYYGLREPKLNNKIIMKCPIVLSYNDKSKDDSTVGSMLNRINRFFVFQYNKQNKESKLIKYRIVFNFDERYTKRFLDVECMQAEDISNAITGGSNGRLFKQIFDKFQDVIQDAVEAYKVDTPATCSLKFKDAYELVFRNARRYIDNVTEKIQLDIASKNKSEVTEDIKGKIIQALNERLHEILLNPDNHRSVGHTDNKEVVTAIITCVENYIAKGKWRYGLHKDDGTIITDVKQWPKPEIDGGAVMWRQNSEILKPVIWFGPQNSKQVDWWSIYGTEEDLKNKRSIWFPLFPHSFYVNALGDTDLRQGKYYWFEEIAGLYSKCGKEELVLDDEVIQQCPVTLMKEFYLPAEKGIVDSMLDKINQLFISQYDKVHGQNNLAQYGNVPKAGTNKYHFCQDIAWSDNEIIAKKVCNSIEGGYKLEKTDESRITIPNSTLRYGMAYSPKLHEELVAFINQYNDYIDFLNDLPGFVSVFEENGLMISKEQALTLWPKKTVDKMFSLNESRFITPLIINKGILYDNYYVTNYTASIEGEKFVLPVGKNEDAYPTKINGKKCMWNWDNNGHDFTYALWRLLGERSVKDEDAYTGEADDDQVYYGFDNYDDIYRFSVEVEIQFIKIFEKLEKLGYLKTYTIKPEAFDVRWYQYGKNDCSIDLALVDESFKKNKLLMEQIELLMWSKPEVLEKPFYFLTDKDNKQYLSDKPAQFGGHHKLKIYGRLDCPSANRYVQQGEYVKHRVFFKDEATAIAAGYRPCAKCMPEAYKKWKAEKKK